MPLRIATFDNATGGNTLYKALAHPVAARPARLLRERLAAAGPVAIYDLQGAAEGFAELHGLDGVDIAGVFVPQVTRLDTIVLGHRAQPATALSDCAARAVLIACFDAERPGSQLAPCLPPNAVVFSLDAMRVPTERLSEKRRYLDPLNFATNFAFFRDAGGLHTRLTTANYWASYGAQQVACWLTLIGEDGGILAEWHETLGAPGRSFVIDSRAVRARFGLGEFCGQLFLHIVGAAGHDVVKYALDTFGSDPGATLSSTHDANAWPAERYAGLPAPAPGERVVLWMQNSHPAAVPAGAIALAAMGEGRGVAIPVEIAPFATLAVDVAELLPGLAWPRQIEIHAGKHMVRPRYEIVECSRRRIAHVNVERDDLTPDPALPRLGETLGKGYLLPAPVMPLGRWQTLVLPTPMATCQAELPLMALVYDPGGREVARHRFGRLPRDHAVVLDLDRVDGVATLGDGFGHVELVYDFTEGGEGDGWLHALFRYRERAGGHAAETSFGAHVFNTVMTYRGEPQSYGGPPPGLSTRLFLRLGGEDCDTFCHLIYPASRPWRPDSATEIILCAGDGSEIARQRLAIPCSGSHLWHYRDAFDAATRARAGDGAYAIVRDTTCRLFGYHGLIGSDGRFSLDHTFGF